MLSNAKCLVTGASSGIGLAICQTLTKYGARVIGTGRNVEALTKLQLEGHIEDFVVADLSSTTSTSPSDGGGNSSSGVSPCKLVVETAATKLGGLTSVVNAAGVLKAGAMGGMGDSESSMENYDFNMITNTRAPFEILTCAIPYLKEAGKFAKEENGDECCFPSVVNISSVNGKQSFPGCVSYCMSKAALDMMTKCASVDLAKEGIRVNSVNPGMVVTNLQKRGGLSDEQYDKFLTRSIEVTHPLGAYLGRCGTPEEVGELVAFLLSNKAKFVTGECIAMDGGRQNLGAR